MESMNLIRKKMISTMFVGCSNRVHVAGPAIRLQKSLWKSAKEKELEKASEMGKEEAESVKEQAAQVKEALETFKDTATTTTKAVSDMSKAVRGEVSKTADEVVDKWKEPAQAAAAHAWEKAAKNIEDKAAEKIRDRVMEKKQQVKDANDSK